MTTPYNTNTMDDYMGKLREYPAQRRGFLMAMTQDMDFAGAILITCLASQKKQRKILPNFSGMHDQSMMCLLLA